MVFRIMSLGFSIRQNGFPHHKKTLPYHKKYFPYQAKWYSVSGRNVFRIIKEIILPDTEVLKYRTEKEN
jgi:hypothetical protein